MSSEFDRYQATYRDAVNDSIGFTGADVDFFARLKADDLVDTVRRNLGAADARFLDVGCGGGLTDRHLAGRVGELHGIDVSSGLLDAAAESNPTVEYHWFDGSRLPFENGGFDVAFAICVFHHITFDGRIALAAEMTRVVRPGGLVVIYEHNPLNPLTRVAVSRCEFDAETILLGLRETQTLLRGAGATVLESRYIAFFPWDRPVLRKLERRLERLPMGGQYAAVGRLPTAAE